MTDTTREAVERLIDRIHESKAGRDVRTDAIATLRALSAEVQRLKAPGEPVAFFAPIAKNASPEDAGTQFDRADWYWRTMDPDDCGDSPEEAINRAMIGRFCVCEIASSYNGPTRYGFIAPVLDHDGDDDEVFLHFATQDEAIAAAKVRAALAKQGGAE